MKSKLLFMTIMLTATQSFAQTWEVGGAFNGYFPRDSLWKQQVSGGEFKLAYWPEKLDIGVALNIGKTTWDVEPQTTYQTNVIEDTISGQANYTSLGLSVLTRGELPESPNVLLTLEAGFGYMMGSADMQITSITYNTDPANRFILDTETFSLEGSDGWVGRIAAGLELVPDDVQIPFKLFVRLGYQFDLDQGSVTEPWLQYQQDLSLTGGFVQLGALIFIQ